MIHQLQPHSLLIALTLTGGKRFQKIPTRKKQQKWHGVSGGKPDSTAPIVSFRQSDRNRAFPTDPTPVRDPRSALRDRTPVRTKGAARSLEGGEAGGHLRGGEVGQARGGWASGRGRDGPTQHKSAIDPS